MAAAATAKMAAFEMWLGELVLTESRAPALLPAEVTLTTVERVSLYLGDERVHRDGVAIVTSHRVLWLDSLHNPSVRRALPLALVREASKSAGFLVGEPKITLYLREIGADKERLEPPKPGYARLAFHGSAHEAAFDCLNKALQKKEWEKSAQAQAPRAQRIGFDPSRAGVGGVIANTREAIRKEADDVTAALADLKSLMNNAKDMVALAQRYSQKLGSSSVAEKDEFNSLLVSMGIQDPVSKATAGGTFHVQLARQLAEVLRAPLERLGGMITLPDAFCLVNRARGTDLLSPDDLMIACHWFQQLNLPLELRRFESGVIVIRSLEHTDAAVAQRIIGVLRGKAPPPSPLPGARPLAPIEGVSPWASVDELELSLALGFSVVLARQALLESERLGFLCRDESAHGLRFHVNVFK